MSSRFGFDFSTGERVAWCIKSRILRCFARWPRVEIKDLLNTTRSATELHVFPVSDGIRASRSPSNIRGRQAYLNCVPTPFAVKRSAGDGRVDVAAKRKSTYHFRDLCLSQLRLVRIGANPATSFEHSEYGVGVRVDGRLISVAMWVA